MSASLKPSISIIVPALNEEEHLPGTLQTILCASENKFSAMEICIYNDGSTDATGQFSDDLAKNDSRIKVIHNNTLPSGNYSSTCQRGIGNWQKIRVSEKALALNLHLI